MARRKAEPRWVTRQILDTIHDAQVREHGGAFGVRDDGLLESAVGRPRHKLAYAKRPDLALLAAAYMFGLARNHGYVDGNKRVAFLAGYVFLGLNGYDLDAPEAEVVGRVESIASGQLRESALASWIRGRLRPIER